MNEAFFLRLLDANANRAAEGLRTFEDVARLINEDATVAGWIKTLRHELTECLAPLPRERRLAHRSTETDAGTKLCSASELRRQTAREIVAAAAERVGQSLRVLEEAAKGITELDGNRFKQLRYRAYDVLAQAEIRLTRGKAIATAKLYLLIDCQLEIAKFTEYVRELVAAGVDAFQIRDKSLDGARLIEYTHAAIEATRDTEALVIVNDRIDIALVTQADGVHLGQEDIGLGDARRLVAGSLLIGISTHNIEQARAAEFGGADYIGCGPMFPSGTKQFSDFPGLQLLSDMNGNLDIPAFALGGVTLERLPEIFSRGGRRVALSAAIHQAINPFETARQFKLQLEEHAGSAAAF